MSARPPLEQYLRRATRGLSRPQRLKVRAELEEHILERAWAAQCAGLNEDQALQAALDTLGDAGQVRRGLQAVHVAPQLWRWSALTLLLGAVTLFPTLTAAQVPVLNSFPTLACLADTRACLPSAGWLNVDSLTVALRQLGVTVRPVNAASGAALQLVFPGSRAVTVPTSQNLGRSPDQITSSRFLSSNALVYLLAEQSGLPVSLEGWINPQLRVGTTKLTLGTAATPFEAYGLYTGALLEGLRRSAPPMPGVTLHWARGPISPFTLEERHTLQVSDTPGTVYGLLTRDPSGGLYLDAAPVDGKGQVTLTALWKDILFVPRLADVEQLIPPRQPLGQQKYALLLRLTGRVDPAVPNVQATVPSGVRSIADR
ncbi:hypothetical protein E7T06_18370 [Deinococcus sp. Arct2-2]|uniref:permease prefix domain 1-containing protein n=1 Tax=Deinococcus sp. Arct2-2 TaxID=2568653 RepID=UPI0010A35C2E|nr:permease prefix domain 1-containing protein [Deinococcus sp. Arct2-2]THF68005.1 hypothetical protein E7T06_18370 [Deinococcus sp. Arct2-2]